MAIEINLQQLLEHGKVDNWRDASDEYFLRCVIQDRAGCGGQQIDLAATLESREHEEDRPDKLVFQQQRACFSLPDDEAEKLVGLILCR